MPSTIIFGYIFMFDVANILNQRLQVWENTVTSYSRDRNTNL